MIRRRHVEDGVWSEAVYSDCERYRYALTRTWASDSPRLTWVMLNPSTADERRNDPTIERCQRRTVALGFGAMRIANLFAWRATDPKALKKAASPEGADNAKALEQAFSWADTVILGWGVHGAHRDAGPRLLVSLRRRRKPIWHLGLTQAGHPRHPLYVSYGTEPMPLVQPSERRGINRMSAGVA